MTSGDFKGIGIAGLAMLAACSPTAEPAAEPAGAEQPPNIILIIADDISQDFGAYGGAVETPHFDALAQSGVLFTNAYVAASSCSPSRNSLITGRYPHNHGAPELHMPLPAGQFAFPAALRDAGYHTVAAGKWHMGPEPVAAFDRVNDIAYPDDFTGAQTWIPELRARPMDRPFFFWFAAFDAHRPWEPDPELTPTDPSTVDLPAGLPDTPATRDDFASYLDEVRRFDSIIGDVVAELEVQGVLNDTLLLVTSDNGRPFPRAKTTLFEAGMRTPLVAHWPNGGLPAGSVSESLISLIDVAPTLLELAGVEVPPSVQGVSFASVLQDPAATPRQIVFGERNWHTQRNVGRMVRQGDYVYMRDFTPGDYSFLMVNHNVGVYAELLRLREAGALSDAQAETFSTDRPVERLFDLSIDPDQLRNLVGSPEHAVVLNELRTLMEMWREDTGDTIGPIETLTVDRHDRTTYERLFPGPRPPNGNIPGRDADATRINARGPY